MILECLFVFENIREQDPLKQGLKLVHVGNKKAKAQIREQDPLKQGLKPWLEGRICFATRPIREQDPLKQGLKQLVFHDGTETTHIREQDPLKQGLKLGRFHRSGVIDY